jgi:hypothetical protein
MPDTLFYHVVSGFAQRSTWQMGLYTVSSNPSGINAKNSWQAWNSIFFTAGPTHGFGSHNYMATDAGEVNFLTYLVDQATDRKALIDGAVFPGVGVSTFEALPSFVAPLLLLRPAISGPHQAGRMYLPPITREALDDGALWIDAQTKIGDFLHDGFAELAGQDLHPVVRNRTGHTHVLASKFFLSNRLAIAPTRSDETPPAYLSRTL